MLPVQSLTLLVGVNAIVSVQFLVPLLLVDGLAEYRVLVHYVDRLFLLRVHGHDAVHKVLYLVRTLTKRYYFEILLPR